MFKSEQQEYTREGVPWKDVSFRDNAGSSLTSFGRFSFWTFLFL